MMVPRSFKYSSSPPADVFDEKRRQSQSHRPGIARKNSFGARRPSHPDIRPQIPSRTSTEPAKPVSKPVPVPAPERSVSQNPKPSAAMPTPPRLASSTTRSRTSYPTNHRADTMPPAVAALLAVTAIPKPRPNQFKRRPVRARSISIDELVNSWKADDSLSTNISSSPSLSFLLESASLEETESGSSVDSERVEDEEYLHKRSKSSESIPMLDADNESLISGTGPSTPGSLRSRKSTSNLRKEKPKSLPTSYIDHSHDHPLVEGPSNGDEDEMEGNLTFSTGSSRTATPKPKSSFKSNLTSSLQALKNAAISSISSLGLNNSPPPNQPPSSAQWSDEMLWSHPYIFPRFTTEVRPSIQGTPTEAQRRYLNPTPLTFEEQEAPFQLALHAPYLAEATKDTPLIQMQTYSRARRRSGSRSSARSSSTPDPQSEAGRALLGTSGGMRQRELRENSDFLRVVVLEMNMRREGKLENGKAKIWLPPRQVTPQAKRVGSVPARWVGVSAS